MKLMLFDNYEIFQKNFFSYKDLEFSKSEQGNLIIEVLNNLDLIKKHIKEDNIQLYINEKKTRNKSFSFYLKYAEKCNNENLKLFYELILNQYSDVINSLIEKADYIEKLFEYSEKKDGSNSISINLSDLLIENYNNITTISDEIKAEIAYVDIEIQNCLYSLNSFMQFITKNISITDSKDTFVANKPIENMPILDNGYFSPLQIPEQKLIYIYQDNFKIKEIRKYDEFNSYNIENIKHAIIYNIDTCEDFFNVFKMLILEKKIHINHCRNCGKYFMPTSRTDEVYCDNLSPQNKTKTCKEYGAKKTYRDKISSDRIKSTHNLISQLYRMRINRSKDLKQKAKYEKEFDTYKSKYQKKKEKYNNGKGTLKENEFYEWLKNQKEKATNSKKNNV